MGNHEKRNIMNWIILVIIGKYFNWYYLSSGEQKGRNKPKGKKTIRNCWKTIQKLWKSNIIEKKAYYCKQQ